MYFNTCRYLSRYIRESNCSIDYQYRGFQFIQRRNNIDMYVCNFYARARAKIQFFMSIEWVGSGRFPF